MGERVVGGGNRGEGARVAGEENERRRTLRPRGGTARSLGWVTRGGAPRGERMVLLI